MTVVTLPGATGGIVTVQAGTGDHVFVAQIIANTILLASVGGSLNTPVAVTVSGSTTNPGVVPPALSDGKGNILYLTGSVGGGTFAVPTGYNYVVDLMTAPETITGSNLQLIGFDSAGSTYVLTGNSSVVADPQGPEVESVTGTANLASGPGNDSLFLTGAGTVDAGTGSNFEFAAPTAGGAGIRVQSEGAADTISLNMAFGGNATVVSSGANVSVQAGAVGSGTVNALFTGNAATFTGGSGTDFVTTGGSAALITGGTGALAEFDGGTGDTVVAGFAATAAVSLGGTDALVFGGNGPFLSNVTGTGNTVVAGASTNFSSLGGSNNFFYNETSTSTASVEASGTGDTIVGGTGPLAVTASASAFGTVVYSFGGSLSFVGNNGPSTIVAGSGNVSVTGGAGGTTLFGASGGEVTYSGTTGVLNYAASGGNETLNASGSTTNDLLYGSQFTGSADTLIGGTGNDTLVGGVASDSLVGNASSHDWFVFIAANGSIGAGASETVTGFSSNSEVWLANYGPGAAAAATASATTSNGNTVLNLGHGTTVTFIGVTSASEFQGHIISN
jgi:hypothetical protein